MSSGDKGSNASDGWQECARWLTRCRALRGDHKANWPSATAFDLAYTLRDGVLLCNLLNAVDPGCVDMKDINQKPQLAQFLCLRNIKTFLSVCSTIFGLSDSELFEPSMLFDLSNFHRVLCTLSALSVCPRLRRKGIEGFSIGRDRSHEENYKDLQSAGVGREDEGRRRRLRRIEGDEAGIGEDDANTVEEEDCYGEYCSRAQSEEIYQDLCSLQLPLASCSTQGVTGSGGEKREYVVQELVETERNYCEVLGNVLRHFVQPLARLLDPEDTARIFFGIKELSEIHAGFHYKLQKARNGADLGRVFLECRKQFLIYGGYCANLTVARNMVQEVCSRNEVINQEVLRCQDEANDGKFKLRDILSVPMQRILKYHLLLENLVKETPREWIDDRRLLEKAKEAMVDVAQYINEVKRDSDTLDIIKNIQGSIVDWDVSEDVQLKDFGRLLKDGELKVKAHDDQRVKARWAFVFEQAVLICKAGRGDQYYYKKTLRLDDYKLEDPIERRILGRDSRWSCRWLLVHKQALHNRMYPTYTLYARTADQKKAWIKALQEAIDNVNPAACKSTNHKFRLTTFDTACCCHHCGKFLKGRIFQGYRCIACHVSVHKHCIMYSGGCTLAPPIVTPPLVTSPTVTLPPVTLPPVTSPRVTSSLPLACERTLSSKPWFVGEMERDTAASKLQHCEDGSYMLRVRPAGLSRFDHETSYALSVKANGVVQHVRVFKHDIEGTTLYYLSDSRDFESVIDLVEYYTLQSLGENFDDLDVRLLWPVR